MSTRGQPWLKFYPADWRSDIPLHACSIAARGLWIEMLTIMYQANPRGHLVLRGEPMSIETLAGVVNAPVDVVTALLSELEKSEIFSRNRAGIIYSRRMVNDEKKANIARKNGKSGGNPTLSNQTQIPASDNQKPTEPDKQDPPEPDNRQSDDWLKGQDNTQKPEARSQKPDSPVLPFAFAQGENGVAASPPPAGDLKTVVFGQALTWLATQTGEPSQKLRPLLGRWCRDHGDAAVIAAVAAAQREGAIEPKAFITKALQARGGFPSSHGSGMGPG